MDLFGKKRIKQLEDENAKLQDVANTRLIIWMRIIEDNGTINQAKIYDSNFYHAYLASRFTGPGSLTDLNNALALKGCYLSWDIITS